MLKNKRILLIISGSISAYKSLDLIRELQRKKAHVQCILTDGGARFITPLSVSALTGQKTYDDLWSLTDETEMGHIRLSRENDLILIAPASANIIAKMAHGLTDDIATATLLASDKPIMVAPAMNPYMWDNIATQNNISILKKRGIQCIGPDNGEMACGEVGTGRMSSVENIINTLEHFFHPKKQPLLGFKALVTSGPTYEPIDPVRFIGNRSSGKQGHAIAHALHQAGAEVTLVSGPTQCKKISGINTIYVETAQQMQKYCEKAMPVDIAVCAAAVSDWAPESPSSTKIKKNKNNTQNTLSLRENKDILRMISTEMTQRPACVVGFAAETDNLIENAQKKLQKKGCDLIVANEVGPDKNGQEKAFGMDENKIYFVHHDDTVVEYERSSKEAIAGHIVDFISNYIERD